MAAYNPILELYPAQFNDKEFSSTNHLSKALLTQSEWLAPFVTHAYGTSANYGSRNFPLSFVTEGMGNVNKISSTDLSYKIGVIGRPKKTSTVAIATYSATDRPGRGHTKFKIIFADRWFHKSLSVFSPSRLECRIQSDPRQVSGGWEYELVLMNPSADAFIPVADLQPGKVWARTVAKVGKERSRGVESRSHTPFVTTNQIALTRDTYKLAGNVKNKVMVLEIKADGKRFKFWTQWEMYLRQLEFKEKCESDLWYSEYNKDTNGVTHVIDEDSGEVVPSGAGMLQQIPNQDSYSFLTTGKIQNLIRDIFFNASDSDVVDVDIYSGTGGMEEADSAMKLASAAFTLVDTKQVTGEGNSMMFGAYFNQYRHIDGHKVTFKKLPLMDRGVMADVSDPHPITGLPLESYNMYCIDNSTYEGQRNIQYVSEAGREEVNRVVPGMAAPPDGYNETLFASSDIDATSVEWMKTQGVQVMKPTNCFKLFNGIS
ncbi:MAG: hypothetical protein ACK53T_02335 [Planctomycetota bacterium]|jgi:hypothetical protein